MSKPVFEDLSTFSGRRNRLSYILFQISMWILFLIGGIIGITVGAVAFSGSADGGGYIFVLILAMFFVVIFISDVAVTAQRFRDIGFTGWAALLTLTPYVGFMVWGLCSCSYPTRKAKINMDTTSSKLTMTSKQGFNAST